MIKNIHKTNMQIFIPKVLMNQRQDHFRFRYFFTFSLDYYDWMEENTENN